MEWGIWAGVLRVYEFVCGGGCVRVCVCECVYVWFEIIGCSHGCRKLGRNVKLGFCIVSPKDRVLQHVLFFFRFFFFFSFPAAFYLIGLSDWPQIAKASPCRILLRKNVKQNTGHFKFREQLPNKRDWSLKCMPGIEASGGHYILWFLNWNKCCPNRSHKFHLVLK